MPAATTAPAGTVVLRVVPNPTLGPNLVDTQGRTQYRVTRDTAGVSNCTGNCLQTWPALTADSSSVRGEGVTGQVTVIQRSDGARQVAYEGMPLYRHAADQAPGETKGHNVGTIWFVVKPTDKAAAVPSGTGPTAMITH